MDSVFGFLINIPSPLKLFGFNLGLNLISSNHWYAVRRLSDEHYYNLDSKLPRPRRIGGREQLGEHLDAMLKGGQCELLLIVDSGVTQDEIVMEGS